MIQERSDDVEFDRISFGHANGEELKRRKFREGLENCRWEWSISRNRDEVEVLELLHQGKVTQLVLRQHDTKHPKS